jgi:hypothetical protein
MMSATDDSEMPPTKFRHDIVNAFWFGPQTQSKRTPTEGAIREIRDLVN